MVGFAFGRRGYRGDACDDAALGVPRRVVGADLAGEYPEVVTVVQNAYLRAIMLFVEFGIRFPSDMIRNSGCGHEVAFVGRVDENLSSEGLTREHCNRDDSAIVEADAFGAIEPFIAKDGDSEFFHVIFEDLLGDAGFEDPHGALFLVHGHRALPLIAEGFALLVHPGFGLLIVLPDAVVEVAGEAADDGFISAIRVAQTPAA